MPPEPIGIIEIASGFAPALRWISPVNPSRRPADLSRRRKSGWVAAASTSSAP
jgi:hypothetical protein